MYKTRLTYKNEFIPKTDPHAEEKIFPLLFTSQYLYTYIKIMKYFYSKILKSYTYLHYPFLLKNKN